MVFFVRPMRRAGREDELLDAAKISTLCDFGQAYDRIEEMKLFPTDRSALIALALSVAIPALPVVVAEFPLIVILKKLLGALKRRKKLPETHVLL